MHLAWNLEKAKALALQHHQRFDLRILEWKALAEYLQGIAVHPHKTGGRVVHGFSQNRAEHHAEKADAQAADRARARAVPVHVTRADHHLATGGAQRFEDARDIAR